ncbi:MAG: sugar ABC transporter permease [Rectinemataceae bacterium]
MIGRHRKEAERRRAYWSMVLPPYLIFLFVFAFPIVLAIVLSLSDYGGGKMFGGEPWKITGFQQYRKLFADPYFWSALKNNIYIVLVSVFGQLPLGFLFAYLIYRKIVKFGDFWQGVLYVPAIISTIVIGIMWSIIFSPYGPIADIANHLYTSSFAAKLAEIFQSAGNLNVTDDMVDKIIKISSSTIGGVFSNPHSELKDFLLSYGPNQLGEVQQDLVNLLAPKWSAEFLNQRNLAMIPICFVTLWMWTGTYLILFHANMQKIDSQILEAAQIDGASEMQVMRFVVVPSLSGVILNASILCISGSLSGFALILAMTGGGPARVTQVLSIYMYDSAFMGAPNYPLANAIAMMIVLFSLVLILFMFALEKRFGGKE